MSTQYRSGFTLLEILVAITITALLVAAAVRAFQDIHRFTARMGAGLHRQRAAEIFLDRLERELNSVMIFARGAGATADTHPWLLRGVDGYEADADADAIKFITSAPARTAGDPVAIGLRMVTYGVLMGEEGDLSLHRFEEPVPGGESKEILLSDSVAILEDIEAFHLSYHDPESENWVETWDSTQIELLDRAPDKIEVSLRLWQKDANGMPAVGSLATRTIHLAAAEFLTVGQQAPMEDATDPNADAEDPDEDCAATVSECVDHFQLSLSEADPRIQNLVEHEAEFRPDACFNPEGPLAELLKKHVGYEDECH